MIELSWPTRLFGVLFNTETMKVYKKRFLMRIIRREETIPNSLTETTRVKHELTLALKLKGN